MREMISHKVSEVDIERINRLEKRLGDWGAYGDYDAFEAWLVFHNKNILPFSGGYLEQPKWIRAAFKQFNEVYNYHYFTRNRFAPPPVQEGVNPFENLFTLRETTDG